MPVNMVEDVRLDLELSEEENTDWEKLLVGLHEGGAFMWCKACGAPCGTQTVGCSGC
ncbi:hypothetical protein [Streptomyces sp. NPDC001985]|uniref:hypothetical protein n=1 Tax=Streptomyces sp. NPDC001985 TaxID=3154406 RepID=UPI00332D029E